VARPSTESAPELDAAPAQPAAGIITSTHETVSKFDTAPAQPAADNIMPTGEPVSELETTPTQPKLETIVEEAGENSMDNQGTRWTPEQLIQIFKEIVTALLGLGLVIYTLVLANNALQYVGDETKMSDAKDILLLVLGLSGVVIGYYFGRVPADARATQAQEQANAATAQAEQVSVQAQVAAEQVDEIMNRAVSTSVATRDAGPPAMDPALVTELQRIRDELRATANLARKRR
jgi:hypothetical protein